MAMIHAHEIGLAGPVIRIIGQCAITSSSKQGGASGIPLPCQPASPGAAGSKAQAGRVPGLLPRRGRPARGSASTIRGGLGTAPSAPARGPAGFACHPTDGRARFVSRPRCPRRTPQARARFVSRPRCPWKANPTSPRAHPSVASAACHFAWHVTTPVGHTDTGSFLARALPPAGMRHAAAFHSNANCGRTCGQADTLKELGARVP
jgi:hypothetical protein